MRTSRVPGAGPRLARRQIWPAIRGLGRLSGPGARAGFEGGRKWRQAAAEADLPGLAGRTRRARNLDHPEFGVARGIRPRRHGQEIKSHFGEGCWVRRWGKSRSNAAAAASFPTRIRDVTEKLVWGLFGAGAVAATLQYCDHCRTRRRPVGDVSGQKVWTRSLACHQWCFDRTHREGLTAPPRPVCCWCRWTSPAMQIPTRSCSTRGVQRGVLRRRPHRRRPGGN